MDRSRTGWAAGALTAAAIALAPADSARAIPDVPGRTSGSGASTS